MKWRTIGALPGLSLLMCIPALAADCVLQVGPPNRPAYATALIQRAKEVTP
jgi:hypothetical protein